MKIVEPLFVINVELFCVHQQIELKGILKHSVLRPVSHQNTTACCAASWRGRVRGYARSAVNRDAEKTFIERIKHQGKPFLSADCVQDRVHQQVGQTLPQPQDKQSDSEGRVS